MDFKLPDLGEGVDTAEVSQVLVEQGDKIEAEQPVLELENDKATFELPCPHAGTVEKIHVAQGDSVAVGSTILTIRTKSNGETSEKSPSKSERRESNKSDSTSNTKSGTKAVSDHKTAAAGQPRSESDSGASERPKILRVSPDDSGEASTSPPPPAGPATRRLARELGVDLHAVDGTGPSGRITAEDIQGYVKSRLAQSDPTPARTISLPDFSQWGEIEREKLNKIASTSAERLTHAWQTIPHVTQHDLADITELEQGRKKFVAAQKEGNPKVTMTALAMKAVAAALQKYPNFNSSFDPAARELIVKKYYNIGIAVDTPHGLMVPVIRQVDEKSVLELAAELTEVAERTRNRKLSPDAMRGGTFTVSNLGGIGGTAFTPIVNPPEVAILGISSAKWQPVFVDSEMTNRLMLPLSLSYDHRVINGADGARFVRMVATILSEPFQFICHS